jgi:hypothetical protein
MIERHTPERLAGGLAGGDELVEPATAGFQRRIQPELPLVPTST